MGPNGVLLAGRPVEKVSKFDDAVDAGLADAFGGLDDVEEILADLIGLDL